MTPPEGGRCRSGRPEQSSAKQALVFALAAAILPLGFAQCGRKDAAQTGTDPAQQNRAPAAAERGETAPANGTPPERARKTPMQIPGALSVDIPPAHGEPRDFEALSAGDKASLAKLQAEFWQTEDASRRTEILDAIEASCYGKEVLAFLEKVLAEARDEDVRERAVALLAGNTSSDILPVLEKALADSSEAVRAEAAGAVSQVRSDEVVGFLEKVFADEAQAVRQTGLNSIEEQPQARRLKVLGRALQAPHPDVQTGAIDLLQVDSTQKSVEVMFDALDSASPEVREEARFSIDFLLNKEFSNAAEARAWWKEHRQEFDENLAPAQ